MSESFAGKLGRRLIFEKISEKEARISDEMFREGAAPVVFGDVNVGLYVRQIFASGGPTTIDDVDPAKSDARPVNKKLKPGESLFLIASVPPQTAGEKIVSSSRLPHSDPCVDYCIALEGEVHCVFGDGQVAHIKAGDVFVQGGTLHAWHNRTDYPFVFLAVLVGATGAPQPEPTPIKFGAASVD